MTLRPTILGPVANATTIVAGGGLHSLFNRFGAFWTIASVVAFAIAVVAGDVPAAIEQAARILGFLQCPSQQTFLVGGASTTGPRAESREPAGI